MLPSDELISGLREALQLSPENIPLRTQLARALAGMGKWDEAEKELRHALSLAPHDAGLKLALAGVYLQQGKTSQAMVIAEDLTVRQSAPGKAHVLYARLLHREGNTPDAVAQYKLGIEKDPAAADEELGRTLGIGPEFAQGEVVDGRVRSLDDEHVSAATPTEIERPSIKFAQVGGMDAVKEEISIKILQPHKFPELFAAYGKKAGGGILMYGPPGCGKTYLARATAGEMGANFLAVGISDVLDMWIGRSERNLHDLFEQARSHTPCVLFFDEADALGGRRSDMHGGSARQLINQFLSEMDGVGSSNEGVLVLAATNAPWHVDPAFRRPGRFDRILFVPPPDASARTEILRLHLVGKPQETLDFAQLAKATDQFSGADLKATIDFAIEQKLREAMKSGRPSPLTTKDMLAAARQLKPTTKEWFSTARNHAVYSNQGGVYDDVLKYLKLS